MTIVVMHGVYRILFLKIAPLFQERGQGDYRFPKTSRLELDNVHLDLYRSIAVVLLQPRL